MNIDIEEALHREGLKLSSIQKRSVAFFIDELLLSLLLIIAIGDSFFKARTIEETIMFVNQFTLEYIAIKFIYQAFFIMQYGATIGKIVMKIRVIDSKTLQKPDVLVSLNRSFVRVISEIFFYLGFVWGTMDLLRQTWHDKSAKTLVVDA